MAVTRHHTMGVLACIKLRGEKQPNKGTCSLTAADPRSWLKLSSAPVAPGSTVPEKQASDCVNR